MKNEKVMIQMLEGSWTESTELPTVLPFLQAYANLKSSIGSSELYNILISYKSFRTLEDIRYYTSIKNCFEWNFLYVASHGTKGNKIAPSSDSKLEDIDIMDIVKSTLNPQSNKFYHIHFGSCYAVNEKLMDELNMLMCKYGDKKLPWFITGYSKEVDWFDSMIFDLALINHSTTYRGSAENPFKKLLKDYSVLAKRLGFFGYYLSKKLEYVQMTKDIIPTRNPNITR
jgi:hypothetical protein